jgi:hypothetical protein
MMKMLSERRWVFEIKKWYVCKLLKEAESKASTRHYLKNGLETLSRLQNGDQFVTETAIKSACINVIKSPSSGLYSWLDLFGHNLGAGIVEKRDDKDGPVAFKIRKEFYAAVRHVLTVYPNCSS